MPTPHDTAGPDALRDELAAAVDALLDADPSIVDRFLASFPDPTPGGEAWLQFGLTPKLAAATAMATAADAAAPNGAPTPPPTVEGIDLDALEAAIAALASGGTATEQQVDAMEARARAGPELGLSITDAA